MKRYPLSYWKSTDTVTLGRRITKGLLLRWLLTFTLLTMILVVSIIIGLATMSITLKVSQIIIIYCVIFIGLWILIISNLLPSGSSIVTSRFNCIEYTEKGVTYYESTSFIKNLKYLVSILKGNDEVKTSTYGQIESISLNSHTRYMKTIGYSSYAQASKVISVDYIFKFTEGTKHFLLTPLILNHGGVIAARI